MIATLIPANTVQAADEAYNLYYVDQHMQIEQIPDTQFTKVGRYYSGAPCAVTTDNKVWTQPTANDKPAVNPSITAASCADDPNKTNYYLPLHSNIWSAYLTASAPTVTYVGIDADGYLWMSDNDHNVSGSGSAVLGETPVRLGVQFFDGATNNNLVGNGSMFLLGRPRTQTNITVNQMPTTGAPTGLSMIGSVATGFSLLAVALVLIRRQSDVAENRLPRIL